MHHTLTPVLRLRLHVVAIPKAIPRDRPTAWYVAKYVDSRVKADDAHDLYRALCDAHQKQAYEAMSREDKMASLHEIGAGLATVEEALAQWRAKVPAWERAQAERGPPDHDTVVLQAYLDSVGDPRPMIATLEEVTREREAERDWLLEHL